MEIKYCGVLIYKIVVFNVYSLRLSLTQSHPKEIHHCCLEITHSVVNRNSPDDSQQHFIHLHIYN